MSATQATLYDRLGGQSGVDTVVEDIWENHINNPLIRRRYVDSDLENIKRLVCKMFSAVIGGAKVCTDTGMSDTQERACISDEEYVAIINDYIKAMEKNGVGQKERDEVLSNLYSVNIEAVYP